MLVGQLAIIGAAVFTGVAIYINLVEQPARLGLDDQALLTEWKPAYKNGFAMQAPIALIASSWVWASTRWTNPLGNVLMVTRDLDAI
jgi:hypothetical protein